MKSLFAPPDLEYDRQCYKDRFFSKVLRDDPYRRRSISISMDPSWEESGLFWTPDERIVMNDALRLKLQPLFERFKRWWQSEGWKRLFGISSRPLDLISNTKEVWGRKLRRDISDEEARGIIRSFSNLLSLMREAKANAK